MTQQHGSNNPILSISWPRLDLAHDSAYIIADIFVEIIITSLFPIYGLRHVKRSEYIRIVDREAALK